MFYWFLRFYWKYVDIMLLDGIFFNIFCNYVRYNGEVMDEIMQFQIVFIIMLCDLMLYFEVIF